MKLRVSLLGCAMLSLSGTALAQGYEPANSLPWPLWRADAPSIPREALGNAFGEYQFFTGGAFLHSGIDIRGAEGDIVKLVASGNIWMTISYMADRCSHDTDCRIYVRGSDDRYVYYYSHLQLHSESDITAETRSAITAATHWNPATGDISEQPGTDVTVGTVLSRIGPFTSNWPHLHFSVIDSTQNWDAVNPLTALARSAGPLTIVDDERPEIAALEFVRDGSEASVSAPDACTPITGAVDIAATMRDSFYTTDPEPFPVQGGILSTFGVYEAEYLVRRVDTGAFLEGTWYRMDRAPLECAGPDRGTDCPIAMDVNDFAAHSFFQPYSGIKIAQPYTPTLFSVTRSESHFVGIERHVHLLTNTWAEDGRWDTASTGNGWYQVSAIAKDLDGNEQALSRFVPVQNGGTLTLPGEVYVRDNPNDVGAIPSTLGGHPFWTSPDIFVMPAGVVPGIGDTPPETLLEPDTTYDVYVRVKNDSCTDVAAVGVQVYSANPAMIVDTSQWVHITPAGTYQPPGGISVPAAGGTVLFGPFPWTPTADEASSNLGHRCMLAKVDAASDPVGAADVPQNDNIAQRNLQFGLTSFSLGNPGWKLAKIGTELRCNGFPIGQNGALLELRVPYHSALHAAWLGTPGAVVTIAGGQLVVRFTRCNVRLPGVDLKAFEVLPASFKAIAPPNVPGTWTIDLSQTSNGVLGGGMSFLAKSP